MLLTSSGKPLSARRPRAENLMAGWVALMVESGHQVTKIGIMGCLPSMALAAFNAAMLLWLIKSGVIEQLTSITGGSETTEAGVIGFGVILLSWLIGNATIVFSAALTPAVKSNGAESIPRRLGR